MTINQAFEILAAAGGIRAARVITDNTKDFSWWHVHRMAHALRRGVPVAKIIHQKWFFGMSFYTDKNTLDPRPDTETLVESVLSDGWTTPNILDLGTGTGCLIAALVKNIPNSTGMGVDISRGALRVARRNIKELGLRDNIKIRHGSFNHRHLTRDTFDIIVSNPPYIARGDSRVERGAKHDPAIALYAKNNGIAAYQKIAKNARYWVSPNGRLYIEIGQGQYRTVRKIFESAGWKFIRYDRDIGKIIRVLVFSF